VPAELLGPGGGVDHDALTSAGRADEHGGSLRSGDQLKGIGLLAGERPADPTRDFLAGERSGLLADLATGGSGEFRKAPLDHLLARAHRKRRHQPAL
jgi:hypothetical protein